MNRLKDLEIQGFYLYLNQQQIFNKINLILNRYNFKLKRIIDQCIHLIEKQQIGCCPWKIMLLRMY